MCLKDKVGSLLNTSIPNHHCIYEYVVIEDIKHLKSKTYQDFIHNEKKNAFTKSDNFDNTKEITK